MTAPLMPSSNDQPSDATKPETDAESKLKIQRRQHLEHHLRSSPTDLDAFMELAAIYRAEDRPIEAKRILEQAKKIFPDDEKVLWEYEEAMLARSMQQMREVIDLDQRLQTAESNLELSRSQADWAARRIQVCKARLKRDPSLVHLRLVIAEAMLDAETYEEALEEIEPLTKVDEHAAQGNFLKAKCLLNLKRDVEAMVALRAASVRRAVPPPLKIKVPALKLLCETADRLGLELTLQRYREHLALAESQLAETKQSS